MLGWRATAAWLLLLGLASPAQAAAPWFTGIGDLDGGPFDSTASSVSDTGLVVGHGTLGTNQTRPVTWTAAGGLGSPSCGLGAELALAIPLLALRRLRTG